MRGLIEVGLNEVVEVNNIFLCLFFVPVHGWSATSTAHRLLVEGEVAQSNTGKLIHRDFKTSRITVCGCFSFALVLQQESNLRLCDTGARVQFSDHYAGADHKQSTFFSYRSLLWNLQ